MGNSKLVICTYHIVSDMWEIPKLIDTIRPGYRFFLRHYELTQNWETVIYAIPPDDGPGLGLLEKEKGHGEDLEFSAALLDILLASRLIKISSPGKCAGIRLCKWKPEPSSGGGFRDISRGVGSCLCL